MPDRLLEEFAGLGDTFPGSKQKRQPSATDRAAAAAAEREEPRTRWDARPIIYTVEGVDTEFFHIGDLAKALYRTASAMRKWEAKGYIPEARFRTPGVSEKGQHRLYTRAQIEGMIRIATEEGILDHNRQVSNTKFTERARALFKELA